MTAVLRAPRMGVPDSDPRIRAWLDALGRVRGPMADARIAWLAACDRIATRDLPMVSAAHALPDPGSYTDHARRAVETHRAWRGDAAAMRLAQDAADASWRLDVIRRAIADDRAGGAR